MANNYIRWFKEQNIEDIPLVGGTDFEPREEKPIIGFRGAARYTPPSYAEGFALECVAMKRLRDDMGLSNIKLITDQCDIDIYQELLKTHINATENHKRMQQHDEISETNLNAMAEFKRLAGLFEMP